jgi:hypothetical protein
MSFRDHETFSRVLAVVLAVTMVLSTSGCLTSNPTKTDWLGEHRREADGVDQSLRGIGYIAFILAVLLFLGFLFKGNIDIKAPSWGGKTSLPTA